MRRLHAVTLNERFLASGIYRSSAAVESWSLHTLPDGAQLIRVDRDGRAGDGRSLLIEAWRSPDSHVERFDLHAYGRPDDVVQALRAHCTIFDDYAELGQAINGGERIDQEVPLPAGSLVNPGVRALLGHLAVKLVTKGSVPVLAVDVSYAGPSAMGAQLVSAARSTTTDKLIVAHQPVSVQRYSYARADLWLDERQVVIRMGDVSLTQYARSPEFLTL